MSYNLTCKKCCLRKEIDTLSQESHKYFDDHEYQIRSRRFNREDPVYLENREKQRKAAALTAILNTDDPQTDIGERVFKLEKLIQKFKDDITACMI
jgi:hypothetical protein